MILISIIITLAYLFLIGSFVYGFDKVSVFNLEDIPPKTKFSIVIPFRNEAEHLPKLLQSITKLNYPRDLFEVILVDDDSDDNSVGIIENVLDTCLPADRRSSKKVGITRTDISIIKSERVSGAPKKDAINTGIEHSKNEWIITTDADCILPKYWLDSFDEYIQSTISQCIVAPVGYVCELPFLNRFQVLDMLSLQGAAIGGFGISKPFLCNGANLAYRKDFFKTLNGFEGNTHVAGGDDIFLLEKAVKIAPESVHYLKCEQAIVTTQTQSSWKTLKAQRARWAAKTSAYKNRFSQLTGGIVLLMNLILIALFILTLLDEFNLSSLIYILIIKFAIDFYLIYKSATFFDQKEVLRTFLLGFLLYPFFSTYIAFISMFTTFKWKDRHYKK